MAFVFLTYHLQATDQPLQRITGLNDARVSGPLRRLTALEPEDGSVCLILQYMSNAQKSDKRPTGPMLYILI
jgi:hypothetical protein